MRRAIEVVVALAGLAAVAPLMALIALAIKVGDRGPVFFTQTRVGQFGRHFGMHKFRSMVHDAEKKGIPLTAGNDRRITRVGGWLRRTKLDELPQLWNVVKGDMSLVGSRPEVPRFVAFYTADQRRLLDVRPGITDPASLQFFDEAETLAGFDNPETAYIQHIMPHKLAINLTYLRRRSIASDAIVVLATLWRVVRLFKHIGPTPSVDAQRRAA